MSSPQANADSPGIWPWRTGAGRALVGFIAAYVLVFTWLAWRSFDKFGYDSGDIAIYNNLMWHTLHGNPFYVCGWGGRNFLGFHAEFIWLMLLPVYALAPGVHTLLFLQTLATGVAAWPAFLIVRRVLQDEIAAVLLAATFVMLPPIVSQNVNQLHNGPFLLPFLLFAFYFFIERKVRPFLLFAFLACLNRENVALAVAMFGFWALAERRERKWVIAPLVMGVGYFLVVTRWVMPAFLDGKEWHVVGYFSYLGQTAGEVITNALTKPMLVIRHLLGEQNVQYLVLLLQPLAWVLPFGHWAILIGLPDGAGNLLSDNSALKVIGWHYNLLTGAAIFVSAVFTLGRLRGWLTQQYGPGRYAVVLGAGLLALTVSHWYLWFRLPMFQPRPNQAALERAVAFVPRDAAVLSSVRIQGHFSDRPRYEAINRVQDNPAQAATFEYFVLDAHERQYPPFVTQEFFDSFHKNLAYQLVFAENGVFIFRRVGGGS